MAKRKAEQANMLERGSKLLRDEIPSPKAREEERMQLQENEEQVNVRKLEKVLHDENAFLKEQTDKPKERLANMQQTMEESTSPYEVRGKDPINGRSYGIRYIGSCRDEPELECPCVIMNYKKDKAISQFKLYNKMGYEYALQVLHIDNRPGMSGMNVIYPFFKDTMSEWLKKLKADDHLLPKVKDHGKWMKAQVMPKIRKLWKLLLEMNDKKIHSCNEVNDQGYNMALIDEVPKLFNLREGHENIDMNYAISVSREIVDLDTALEFVPKNFQSALKNSWEEEIKNEPINYGLCSKHPVLYDPAEKEALLLLMDRITFRYGLKNLLNRELRWATFLGQMYSVPNEDNKRVYLAILDYKPESYDFSKGSGIVRYLRNALMHFEQTYQRENHKKWDRRQYGEIVEMLDNDLDVCSVLFSTARTIMTDNAPQRHIEEDRLNAKEELENFFSSLK